MKLIVKAISDKPEWTMLNFESGILNLLNPLLSHDYCKVFMRREFSNLRRFKIPNSKIKIAHS
jgi:hypothetical protein